MKYQRPFQSEPVSRDARDIPEVAETDREMLVKLCAELDEAHTASFAETVPVSLARHKFRRPLLSVQTAMAVARRHNRVCPIEQEWRRLYELLRAGDKVAPEPLLGDVLARTPPIARRLRLRDQIEWAAEHGLLEEVYRFIEALPEDHWLHMGQ